MKGACRELIPVSSDRVIDVEFVANCRNISTSILPLPAPYYMCVCVCVCVCVSCIYIYIYIYLHTNVAYVSSVQNNHIRIYISYTEPVRV